MGKSNSCQKKLNLSSLINKIIFTTNQYLLLKKECRDLLNQFIFEIKIGEG